MTSVILELSCDLAATGCYDHMFVVNLPGGNQAGLCSCQTTYRCALGHEGSLAFPIESDFVEAFNDSFGVYGLSVNPDGSCPCGSGQKFVDEPDFPIEEPPMEDDFDSGEQADVYVVDGGYAAAVAAKANKLAHSTNGNTTHGFKRDLLIANNILPSTVAAMAVCTNPDGKLGDGAPYHGDPALAHVAEDLLPTLGGPLPVRSVTKPLVYDAGMVNVPPNSILVGCLQKFSPGLARSDTFGATDPNTFGGLVYTVTSTTLPSISSSVLPTASNNSLSTTDLSNSFTAVPFVNPQFLGSQYDSVVLPYLNAGQSGVVKAVNPGFPAADDYTYTQVLGGYVRGEITFSNSLDSGVVGGVVLNDGKIARQGVLKSPSGYFSLAEPGSIGLATELWESIPWNSSEEFYPAPFLANGASFAAGTTTIGGVLTTDTSSTNTLVPTAQYWNILRWATGQISAPDAFQQSLYPHAEQAYTIEPVVATQASRGLKVRLPSFDLEPMPYGQQGCKAIGNIGRFTDSAEGKYTSIVGNGSSVSPSGNSVFVFRNTSSNDVSVRLTGVLYVTVSYDTSVYFGSLCPLYDPYLAMASIACAHAPLFAPPNSFKTWMKKGWKAVKSAAGTIGPVVADMLLPAALDAIAPGSGEIAAPLMGMLTPVIQKMIKPSGTKTKTANPASASSSTYEPTLSTQAKKAPPHKAPTQPVRSAAAKTKSKTAARRRKPK